MRKRKIVMMVVVPWLLCLAGIQLLERTNGRERIISYFGFKLIGADAVLGAETRGLNPDSVTLASFSDVPGVTEEYVNAYKLFLRAKMGNKEGQPSYDDAANAFQKIASTTELPELKLRSLYFVTFCRFLEMNIDAAYQSGMKVFRLSQSLYKDDNRVKLLEKAVALADSDQLTPATLKTLIAGDETNDLADSLKAAAESSAQEKKLKEKASSGEGKDTSPKAGVAQ